MELLTESTHFIADTFLRGSFISVLVIILGNLLFKDKIETSIPLIILKWILVAFAITNSLIMLISLAFSNADENTLINRTAGPYAGFYFAMFITNSVIPLFLFDKRLGSKAGIILLVTLLMNMGWLFESFVIHVTSLHRDFLPEEGSVKAINSYLPYLHEWIILAKGAFFGLILLTIAWLAKKRRSKSNV